jgi:cation transporter-like permease
MPGVPLPLQRGLRHDHGVDTRSSEHASTHRVARVRAWVAAVVVFVVAFLVIRWLMRQIWPDQGDLSDVGTDLLRVGTSLAVATAAALAAGFVSYRQRS